MRNYLKFLPSTTSISSILLWLSCPVFLTHSSALTPIIYLCYGLQLIDSTTILFNVLDLWVYTFHQIRKHFSLYFFKYFPHPKTQVMCREGHLMLSHSSLILFKKIFCFCDVHAFLCVLHCGGGRYLQ